MRKPFTPFGIGTIYRSVCVCVVDDGSVCCAFVVSASAANRLTKVQSRAKVNRAHGVCVFLTVFLIRMQLCDARGETPSERGDK